MKVLRYKRMIDGLTAEATISPAPRQRLVHTAGGPQPLELIDRKADPSDPAIRWAETEEECLRRITAGVVPPDAFDITVVEVAK